MTSPLPVHARNGAAPSLLRLLVVEDDPEIRRRLEAYLSAGAIPCEVRTAASVDEAVASLRDAEPDLCFLDLDLSDERAVGAVERISGWANGLPVVVMTENGGPRTASAALTAGAVDWVAKDDLDPIVLTHVIRHAIEEASKRSAGLAAREKWWKVFHASPIPMVISDAESGRLLEMNEAFTTMFGWRRSDLAGRSSLHLGMWEEPSRRRELVERVRAEGHVLGEEAGFRTADGAVGRMRVSARRLELDGHDRLLWTVEDVTRQKQAEAWRHLLESSVEAAAHGVLIADREGKIVWVNPVFTEMTGYEREEVLGETPRILHSGVQDEEFYREFWSMILAGETWRGELTNRRKDGTLFHERMSVRPVRHEGSEITHFVAIKEDITEEKARQAELEETTAHLEGLLDMAAGIIFRIRLPEYHVLYVTPNVGALTGFPAERWTGDQAFLPSRVPDEDLERMDRTMSAAIAAGADQTEETFRLRHADGEVHWYRSLARFERDADGRVASFVGTWVDVTEEHELQEQLRHDALHDPLTGLANRTLLYDHLEQAVARARRRPEGIALVMGDLVRFKKINDSLGYSAGDRLLVEVGCRLEESVRREDTVARWGGDEFCVLLTGLDGPSDLMVARDRLLGAFQRPIPMLGQEITIDVTLGAVLSGPSPMPASIGVAESAELIRFASRALDRAKRRGGSSFHLYQPDLEVGDGERDPLEREQDLRRGLQQDEFVPFYQPIVHLTTGAIWAVEPLARWRHPDRGWMEPREFIGLAEETGLVHELGRQMLGKVCRDVARWSEEGRLGRVRITPNVSGREFEQEELVRVLERCLRDTDLAPDQLMLEVTETSIMRATHHIEALRALGIGVLIDDFGTGYSSLLYLRDLDVDGLKIDKSFTGGLGSGSRNRAIVETTLRLGREMGLIVVAEGIETREQLDMLRGMGCTLGQGYLFGEPVGADEIGERLGG